MSANHINGFAIQLARTARLPIAPHSWDLLLRTCSASALVALLVSILVPSVSDLAAFFTMMLIACGPTSAFLPAASEPVLILFAQLYPPLLLATIGVVAVVIVEFLNYSMFEAILQSNKLAKVRQAKSTHMVVTCFESQPFATVAIAAFSPIPFWIARSCAVLARYSIPRYMCATALGRFFRLFLISAGGAAIPLSAGQTLAGGAVVITAMGGLVLVHHQRTKQSRVLAASLAGDRG
jgi:uncharacterized membrane protein YdjX (TVP38/TMEM64 family)